MPDFKIESEVKLKGYKYVCGVDEAGRGPLAGPVCAAAVILPEDTYIEGLNDSKKLTEKKREALIDVIKEKAIAWSVAQPPKTITALIPILARQSVATAIVSKARNLP